MFDNIGTDDVVLAFFPCTRFSPQSYLHFQGTAKNFKNWDDDKKLENAIRLHNELHEFYILICKFAIVVLKRNIKTIIENPYHPESYLKRYWPIKPKIIDKDRREMGDYFTKPTQYFFFNFEPRYNFIFEPTFVNEKRRVSAKVEVGGQNNAKQRATIAPKYANRFIREFVI